MHDQDALLKELDDIHDAYVVDVRQFTEFVRERQLALVEALPAFATWLETEHNGRRYSPATFNRKISAAKSRIRYAFKNSASAKKLRSTYQLEEVLKQVRPKRIESVSVPQEKVLRIDEVRRLVTETKDTTISLMVSFLVGTGVRISEMLGIRLTDLKLADRHFVEILIVGKAGKERAVHVRKGILERIQGYFRGTTYLFEHDGRPFSRISVTNRIKHESLKTIGREATAHNLRHTWATIQLQRGKDVRSIAIAMGHSDPGLTARMYDDRRLEPHEAFLDVSESEGTAEIS